MVQKFSTYHHHHLQVVVVVVVAATVLIIVHLYEVVAILMALLLSLSLSSSSSSSSSVIIRVDKKIATAALREFRTLPTRAENKQAGEAGMLQRVSYSLLFLPTLSLSLTSRQTKATPAVGILLSSSCPPA